MESETADRTLDRQMRGRRFPVQSAALAVGVVFLIVGVLGFIPGITTDYDQMGFATFHSMAALFGVFKVSVLHNLVHLAFGVAGVVLSRTISWSHLFLIAGGLVYLVLFFYGLGVNQHSGSNFVPVNTADNWLHLGLAAGMVLLGFGLAPNSRKSSGKAP